MRTHRRRPATTRPRVDVPTLEARRLLTTLVAIVDTGVDLTSTTDSPYYDLALGYDAYGQRTVAQAGASVVQDNGSTPTGATGHWHGSTIADEVVQAITDTRAATGAGSANVEILPIRATDNTGAYDASAIIRGIDYAADQGAAVIDLSFKATGNFASSTGQTLSQAIAYAASKGAVVSVAAANDSVNVDATGAVDYPMALRAPNMIVSAAVGSNGALSSESNWGPQSVDLGAPGTGGATSFAAGYTSGVIGVISALTPGMSATARINLVKQTVTPTTQAVGAWSTTGGVINPAAAVAKALAGSGGTVTTPTPTPTPVATPTPTPTPVATPTPTPTPVATPTPTPTPIATPTPTPTPVATPTPTPVTPPTTTSPQGVLIAAGSATGLGSYAGDGAYVTGGNVYTVSRTVDLSGVTNPAPEAVYQTERWSYGTLTYTVPRLTPGSTYSVRLDFSENFNNAAGRRLFNVAINGTSDLTNFDIFTAANGEFKAVSRTFTATADASGQITITLTNVVGGAKVDAIRITPTTATATPTPTPTPSTPTSTPLPTTTAAPTTAVSLAGVVNAVGISADTNTIPGDLDGWGYSYSSTLLGSSVTTGGVTYGLGAAGTPDAVKTHGQTVALTAGQYSSLRFLGTGVNGTQTGTFTINYTDGTSTTVNQTFSDWHNSTGAANETVAATTAYRNATSGRDNVYNFDLYAYTIALDPSKTVASVTLPTDWNITLFAASLVS